MVIKRDSPETIANIAITLIHQCDVLIRGLIKIHFPHYFPPTCPTI